MKLYELPENSRIRVEVSTDSGEQMKVDAIFCHIDGAYSFCQLKDNPSEIFHLSASTPMKLCEDGVYEIEN